MIGKSPSLFIRGAATFNFDRDDICLSLSRTLYLVYEITKPFPENETLMMCVCCRYFKETVITFSSTFHIRHAVGGRPFKFTGCQPFVIKDTNQCSG